jgi:hypothetical protein
MEINDLALDTTFEPDIYGEEELAYSGDGEHVDPALITDSQIRNCRLLASIECVEYGKVSIAPGTTVPAMLLCIDFTFHPLETRVKEADVEIAWNKATIAILQPESIDDDETSETVRKKLSGEFKIGYEPIGVGGSVGGERESEREKKSERRIRGSGLHTDRAVWTLRENSQNKNGIHLKFVTVLIVKISSGVGIELDLEIRAKLGPSIGNGLGIRKAIISTTKQFDGKTLLGSRPATLDISTTCFTK